MTSRMDLLKMQVEESASSVLQTIDALENQLRDILSDVRFRMAQHYVDTIEPERPVILMLEDDDDDFKSELLKLNLGGPEEGSGSNAQN